MLIGYCFEKQFFVFKIKKKTFLIHYVFYLKKYKKHISEKENNFQKI